jgi:hypothetical protein
MPSPPLCTGAVVSYLFGSVPPVLGAVKRRWPLFLFLCLVLFLRLPLPTPPLAKKGQKLEDFTGLGPDAFIEEVCKRRPEGEGHLTPGSLRDLRSGYAEMAEPVKRARTEAAGLERKLSDLVNQAYGLTDDEVGLLWKTTPPRMPRFA